MPPVTCGSLLGGVGTLCIMVVWFAILFPTLPEWIHPMLFGAIWIGASAVTAISLFLLFGVAVCT